ncbi:MAG TPA: hypothetical protein G4O02_18435, partial [Caldilineae bacterium]|nr:hypothetical protein [Caldilineae bacterium]
MEGDIRSACATVALPGTCGEWVQGTLDGTPCLVSCPIDWYAQVTIVLNDSSQQWRVPPDAPKTFAALRRALAARGAPPVGGIVRLDNPLPRGRGYASSTADVAGTIYALGEVLGRPFTPAEVARLAVCVEPSDSIMFPQLALFAHRDAAFHKVLGPLPPMGVVVLDPGGAVDTLAFNAADHRAALRRLAPLHREAFGMLEAGLASGDARLIAQAATMSAVAHQAVLSNPLVDEAMRLAKRIGAWGICRAHSGTLVGILCDPEETPDRVAWLSARLPAGVVARPYRCVSGFAHIDIHDTCREKHASPLSEWPNYRG